MRIAIAGIGIVSAAGNGVAALRDALDGLRTPEIRTETVPVEGGEIALPVYAAAPEGLEDYFAVRKLRRLDRLARMSLLAACQARHEAGEPEWDPERVGIVFGSGYGPLSTTFAFQDSFIEDGDKCASPTPFANSVHNAPASTCSIFMNLRGACQTNTTFHQTTVGALMTATDWLKRGRMDYVLAVFAEEHHPVRSYGHVMESGWTVGVPRALQPLDVGCSALPGEGAVCLLLGGETPRFGCITSAAFGRVVGAPHALVLAAEGNRDEVAGYRSLMSRGIPIATPAVLRGAMPTGLAFDLAATALMLQAGSITQVVADEPFELAPNATVACVQVAADGDCGMIMLERCPGGA